MKNKGKIIKINDKEYFNRYEAIKSHKLITQLFRKKLEKLLFPKNFDRVLNKDESQLTTMFTEDFHKFEKMIIDIKLPKKYQNNETYKTMLECFKNSYKDAYKTIK